MLILALVSSAEEPHVLAVCLTSSLFFIETRRLYKTIHSMLTICTAAVTGATANPLGITAFANTDGTTAIQVINNGLNTETVTLAGLTAKSVRTYLSNQANNFTEGTATLQGGMAVADVPGKSLLSFYVS